MANKQKDKQKTVGNIIYRKASKTIAKKRKRTNSGGQDITQNNRQYNGQKEMDTKTNNGW